MFTGSVFKQSVAYIHGRYLQSKCSLYLRTFKYKDLIRTLLLKQSVAYI